MYLEIIYVHIAWSKEDFTTLGQKHYIRVQKPIFHLIFSASAFVVNVTLKIFKVLLFHYDD